MRFVVITGMSGAGRKTAAHALEDVGWYVVDNLPPSLIPHLLDVARERDINRVAVVMDVRTRSEFEQISDIFDAAERSDVTPQILFLEANDETIVKRQEANRRPHPLQGDGLLLDGITRERRMLSALRAAADLVIDTSKLNVHQLSNKVVHAFDEDPDDLRVSVMSFGFKNGIPLDADMVLDVRFLPNPYWVPDLRPQTGLSHSVSSYVLGFDSAQQYLDAIEQALIPVCAGYLNEGKRLATIAIGCTGGKHRSTAMTVELTRRLNERGITARAIHRDLGLE